MAAVLAGALALPAAEAGPTTRPATDTAADATAAGAKPPGAKATDAKLAYDTAAYDKASAHDPHYEDRSLWPAWVEKTDFVKETWPKARLLVYAHAGKSLRRKDLMQPANWLEDGKPATRPIDENTDLYFPGADSRYRVNGDPKSTTVCRHITVGRNVGLGGQKFRPVHGNVWVKRGGSVPRIFSFKGGRSVFVRNDNPKPKLDYPPYTPSLWNERNLRPSNMSSHLRIEKHPDKSVEIMGASTTRDDLNLVSGAFIVGPGSIFLPGDRSIQGIYPKAKLILLSGARFHKHGNQHWHSEIVVAGALLAGTPDRPLTRSCYLGLSYKAKGRNVPSHQRGKPNDRGLVVLKSGRLHVYSADPAKARLEIGWHGIVGGSYAKLVGTGKKQEAKEFQAIPHKIDMVLLGDVRLNGVVFDYVMEGGILLPDVSARDKWKNIFYGRNNAAPPERLFKRYDGPTEFKLKG
jgi:hypothetical protein